MIRTLCKQLIAAGALTLLVGCSHLPWQVLPTDTGVEQLCAQHRYVTALKALDARKNNTPDYAQRRDAVLEQARQYQSDLLKQATALIQTQQFAKAQTLLEADRAELPASRELSQFDEQFTAARDKYIQRWLDELVLLRAPALAKEHIAYQALQKAAAEPELQRMVARHQADVEYFAPLIAKAGNQALAQGDYIKAAQYLRIANQLAPASTTEKQMKIAEQAIVTGRQKQQAALLNEREQRYRDLRVVLEKSLLEHDYFAARDLLDQAKVLNTHSDELDALQNELDISISHYVIQQTIAGNKYYADGRIEQALESWRAANALTPTPELNEKIDKAQKFLDRLQQLQKPPAKP